ncbi:YbhB/YbcL family Raf kinase inhibitor-like protein [Halostella sp. JP-L12]|uniref:YbhB/YbcL family Raf kinase inhibitor-like protein n=1 Tax=Halostella TaxID=1843185 RepID=UPI000EF8027A|nr:MULTISPECIES: YbhB/YbcL family Raf kinase inhibitor-like protein [Halostella]NHN49016.1 YbhB/YbcL family Raf kinase inhibitor-like protein [Halostella sp. JP-L12]
MPSRRALIATFGSAVTALVAGCADDDADSGDADATDDGNDSNSDAGGGSLQIVSDAFEAGGEFPERHTCDGADESPPLSIEGSPDDAEALALVLDDPDAGEEPFVHWLLWNVPADSGEIPGGLPQSETVEELDGARQGTNDFGEVGYRGPCPPEGDDAHTYRFRAYALASPLGVEAGAETDPVLSAIEDRMLTSAQTSADYER